MPEAAAARPSIRRRLLFFLTGSLLLIFLGAALVTYRVAVTAANDTYDRALLDPAVDLAENIKFDAEGPKLDLPHKALDALVYDQIDRVIFQVRFEDGRLLGGEESLPPPPRTPAPDEHVFFDGVHEGMPIRLVALRTPTGVTIQVGETLNKRTRLIKEIVVAEIVPTLLIAAVAIALVWVGVARGLRPLERVSRILLTRSAGDLSPIPETGAPLEIHPVMEALDRLLAELRHAKDFEQRFLANAAHQLRTPLAGLQMHLELLSRRSLPDELRADVDRMRIATSRAGRLASQLLALARAESAPDRGKALDVVDLMTVSDAAARDWAPKAIARQVDLGFALEPAPMLGDAYLIPELLDNLIDNALRHTPVGGSITVSTGQAAGRSYLTVEDTGPGIPAAERNRVFERFYRVPGTGGDGSGLGLSIVKEIAERFRGRVHIRSRDESGGTRVLVEFP